MKWKNFYPKDYPVSSTEDTGRKKRKATARLGFPRAVTNTPGNFSLNRNIQLFQDQKTSVLVFVLALEILCYHSTRHISKANKT